MLDVQQLESIRGDRRLYRDLSFSLQDGEILYLRGHNGSGKTTLLRTLSGLMLPTAGDILWNNENITEQKDEYANDLLYIGHKNGVKGDLTCLENLHFSCALDEIELNREMGVSALVKMGLRGYEDLPSHVLSQGQTRRVALARLLLSRHKLWILDEPFTALDVAAVDLLQQVIRDHVATGGMVMLTTHQEVALTSGSVKEVQLGWKKPDDV